MPAARPSSASVKNVIEAMKACGITPGRVCVSADGSFTVEEKESDDQRTAAGQSGPRRFGQAR